MTEAHIVCRQMGYPGAALASHSELVTPLDKETYPILYDNFHCRDNSTHLSNCQFEEYSIERGCQSVQLLCQLPQPTGKKEKCSMRVRRVLNHILSYTVSASIALNRQVLDVPFLTIHIVSTNYCVEFLKLNWTISGCSELKSIKS